MNEDPLLKDFALVADMFSVPTLFSFLLYIVGTLVLVVEVLRPPASSCLRSVARPPWPLASRSRMWPSR